MAIDDVKVPYSDGWWLDRLYCQLRVQSKRCTELQKRYAGDAPLPFISDIQAEAVKWFVEKSRTNFERVIVNAVLSRLQIVGIRTTAKGGTGEGGDSLAFTTWKKARGKLFTLDVHKMALAMSKAYLIVGKDSDGNLLVTAEDPRLVTAICDPGNPYKVLAALKLYHDDVADQDVAYLYLPGRVMVATKPRKTTANMSQDVRFNPAAYSWDLNIVNSEGAILQQGLSGPIPELATKNADGTIAYNEDGTQVGGMVAVVPFENEDGVAEFEPFLAQIDRINQQILQRMTIATVQAFHQRAIEGLPKTDPDTGAVIDYNSVFTADPGAIWNLPPGAKIQELSQAAMGDIIAAIRDDVQDLYATSGTPAYLAAPDAANGSAAAAALQREQTVSKVEIRQDRFEVAHEIAAELMFRYLGDEERSAPGGIEIIWARADRASVTEQANAVAQTKDVASRYWQSVNLLGMTPAEADRNSSELTQDFIEDQLYAVGLKAATGATTTVTNNDSTAAA